MPVEYPKLCAHSQFKDDRHNWAHIMAEDSHIISFRRKEPMQLIRCSQCRLMLLVIEVGPFNYEKEPRKTDVVLYAGYDPRQDEQ